VVHSLHAYFLRRGDCNAPIVYQVDRSLDGHSFANRRVVAIQHGQQIFTHGCLVPGERGGFRSPDRDAARAAAESLADTSGPPARCSHGCRSGCGASSSSRDRLNSAWCKHRLPAPAARATGAPDLFRAVDALGDDEMPAPRLLA